MSTDPRSLAHAVRLASLRAVAMRNPGRAADQIRVLLDSPGAPPPPQAMQLELLMAEDLLRAGRHAEALDAAFRAADTAVIADPPDSAGLALALLIGADIAVCAGHDDAVDACEAAIELFADLPDPGRLVHARARYAVALFHRGHLDRARRELAGLIQRAPANTPIAVMLTTARDAMDQASQPGPHYRTVAIAPPLAGGILQPSADQPACDELAHRVRAQSMHYRRTLGGDGEKPPP